MNKLICPLLAAVFLMTVCACPAASAEDAQQHLLAADGHFNEGRYEQAVKEYDKAVAADPSLAAAYYHRGLALYKMDSIDKAIDDFGAAISLSAQPLDAQLYYNRGLAYFKKGNYDEAIEDYTKALAINDKFTESYHNRGICYSRKGDYDRSIAEFNRALSIRPGYMGAYFSRGVAYVRKAEEDFRRVCQSGNKAACDNLKQISD